MSRTARFWSSGDIITCYSHSHSSSSQGIWWASGRIPRRPHTRWQRWRKWRLSCHSWCAGGSCVTPSLSSPAWNIFIFLLKLNTLSQSGPLQVTDLYVADASSLLCHKDTAQGIRELASATILVFSSSVLINTNFWRRRIEKWIWGLGGSSKIFFVCSSRQNLNVNGIDCEKDQRS